MNTLGLKPEDTGEKDRTSDFLPATLRNDDEISLFHAIFISFFGHIFVTLFVWGFVSLILYLLLLLGVKLSLFEKPPAKTRDIEFVLVNSPEQQPINKNTKYRADRNSRAGGKHDPTKRVSEPSAPTMKSRPQQKSAPSVQQQHQAQRPQQRPEPQKSQRPKQKEPVKTAPKVTQPKPTPPRLAPTDNMPKPKPSMFDGFKIPVPPVKSTRPQAKTGSKSGVPSGSPLGTINPGRSSSKTGSQGGTSGHSGSPSSSSGRSSSPYSLGNGNIGNPGPGNPNGRPGIDAIKEPDFGPYMRDLQDRIKRRWEPPRGNESKRVVLYFKIARDGRLLKVSVSRSSGLPSADKAAIDAVENAAPFKPLPPEFRGSDVEIQFTFDYNVFGASRY